MEFYILETVHILKTLEFCGTLFYLELHVVDLRKGPLFCPILGVIFPVCSQNIGSVSELPKVCVWGQEGGERMKARSSVDRPGVCPQLCHGV